MGATKKAIDLEEKGIKKPSSERLRNSDKERISQQKRDQMGTKKPKDEYRETSLDHPQHSYSEYERSHTSSAFEKED